MFCWSFFVFEAGSCNRRRGAFCIIRKLSPDAMVGIAGYAKTNLKNDCEYTSMRAV